MGDTRRSLASFIHTVGIERASAKVGPAHIAYDMRRLILHERHPATR
jgi:hypothetical protein